MPKLPTIMAIGLSVHCSGARRLLPPQFGSLRFANDVRSDGGRKGLRRCSRDHQRRTETLELRQRIYTLFAGDVSCEKWPLFVFLNSFRPSFALLVFCSLSPFFFFRTCRKDADRKSRRQEKTSKAAEKSELRRRDRHGVQEEAEPTGSVSHMQLASSSLAAFNS
ncbi:translation machinery associated tma7 protein, partial [Toxoplasma gondii RUB]